MVDRFIAWCCPGCGLWQSSDLRLNRFMSDGAKDLKLGKTVLKCYNCNKSRKFVKKGLFSVLFLTFESAQDCTVAVGIKKKEQNL
jgi:hypothetical protein